MRIALTMGVLRVPPTYFAVNHAQTLREAHEFHAFALAAEVTDAAVQVPVSQSLNVPGLSFESRMRLGPLSLPHMTRAVRRFRPDLIHQHFATWCTSAASIASGGVPLVTTVHGYDVLLATRSPRSTLERWHQHNVRLAQSRSNRVLAVSNYLASRAVKAGFDSQRLEVHYQGVDTDFFTPATDAPNRGGVPEVVFVGAISRRKGTRDLIDASRALVSSHEHRLVIIGGGELDAELRAETASDNHIEFAGSLDRAGVRARLQQATVMVLPTQEDRGWREAAGLVLLEAQACGTPVVAYDSGGTSEMVDDGTSGILVKERDVNALGDAIGSILRLGTAEAGRLRTQTRDFVVTQRSLAVSARELTAHYEQLALS